MYTKLKSVISTTIHLYSALSETTERKFKGSGGSNRIKVLFPGLYALSLCSRKAMHPGLQLGRRNHSYKFFRRQHKRIRFVHNFADVAESQSF